MSHSNKPTLQLLSSYCWLDKDHTRHAKISEKGLKSIDLEPIVLKQVPPIKRRRLNGLSKMAMHTSLSCLETAGVSAQNTLTVFASEHGELNRTISIIEDIASSQEVSPKDFSLSVHNASLGLFSIFNKNTKPGTSIAAGSNTFGFALLEAYNLLTRFPDKKVLLTCFDLKVEAPFDTLQKQTVPSYSLSVLLSLDTNQSQPGKAFSFGFRSTQIAPVMQAPLALAFYDFLHNEDESSQLATDRHQWVFTKHAL
ncbi:beta-ketoacyl synthase chain length factor [Kangiella japonica]